MGYYSDVAIKCRPWAFNLIVKAIKKHSSNFRPDDVYFNEKENLYTIRWKWVKWYEQCKEVKAIMDVLDDIIGNDAYESKEYDYKFVRIGEEFDDSEETCRNDDYDIDLDIVKYIDTHSDDENSKDVNIDQIDEWFI